MNLVSEEAPSKRKRDELEEEVREREEDQGISTKSRRLKKRRKDEGELKDKGKAQVRGKQDVHGLPRTIVDM